MCNKQVVYIINCILFKTKRFERELGALAEKEFEDFPFHYTYGYIITVLYKEGNSKAVDIPEKLGLDPSTITRMVNKLEEQGVVKRGIVKSKKEIVLTPKGKELVPDMSARWAKFHEKLYEHLERKEVKEIRDLLEEKIMKFKK